jgi:hypothetical protein
VAIHLASVIREEEKALEVVSTTRDVEGRVRAEAQRSPKAGLQILSAEIEREIRPFMAATGFHQGGNLTAPLPQALGALAATWQLPENVTSASRSFWDVGERVRRGYDVADSDVLRSIESGLLILKTLQSLRREKKVVLYTELSLFSDAAGKQSIPGVWGLMLENTSSDGKETKSVQVLPTSRMDYRVGDELTWEFDLRKVHAEAWYRDPADNQIKHAWQQAAEFAGRPLQEVNAAPR